MHLSQWTTNQGTYIVSICTFIKSNRVAASHFFVFLNQEKFQGFLGDLLIHRAHPHNTRLCFLQRDPQPSIQRAGATADWTQRLVPATVGLLHCIQSWSFFKRNGKNGNPPPRQRSSSQLLRASGQAGGLQVTLELPHCNSVQGAKVEVKSSVCDVEVSRLFNQVHNLKTEGTIRALHSAIKYLSKTCFNPLWF